MDTALVDSYIYLGIGIIAAVLIHIIFTWIKKKAELTEMKMDDLLVHSLGRPLVMLAFLSPFFWPYGTQYISTPSFNGLRIRKFWSQVIFL